MTTVTCRLKSFSLSSRKNDSDATIDKFAGGHESEWSMLRCVAVCCGGVRCCVLRGGVLLAGSMLLYVAAKCVAVCCSLQRSVLQCVTVCCSENLHVLCCCVLQCVGVECVPCALTVWVRRGFRQICIWIFKKKNRLSDSMTVQGNPPGKLKKSGFLLVRFPFLSNIRVSY